MPLFKAKALVNGAETEVELDDEKFLTTDAHNQRLTHTVQERLARKEAEVVARLEKDDEFWKKLATTRGFDPEKKAELDSAAAERLKREILATEVEPLKEKLTERERFADELLGKTKRAELQAAFARVAKPGLVELLVERYQRDLHYDAKSGTFGLKNAQGEWVWSTNTNDGKTPYRGITELVEQWAKDPANKEFLATPPKQGGAGVGSDHTGTGGEDLSSLPPAARIARARQLGYKT